MSIDCKRGLFGRRQARINRGRERTGLDPATFAVEAQRQGAGEILLTSIDRDGTYSGYDHELISQVSTATSLPVIACGGARDLADMQRAVSSSGASAAAAGSLFVYRNANRGVLINYPDRQLLEDLFD